MGTAPGGSRADSASAAMRAIAHRAPAGRRQPALRSRVALQASMTTSGAQSPPCAACCGSTDDDSEMPDAATQSVSAAFRRGTPSIRLDTPPSNAASAAGVRGDEGQQDGSRAGVLPARDPAWPTIPSGGGLPTSPPPSPPAAAVCCRQEQRPPTAPATLTAPCPRPHCRRCRRRRCRRRRRRRHRRRSPSSPLQHWPPPPRRRHAGCAAQYHASLVA